MICWRSDVTVTTADKLDQSRNRVAEVESAAMGRRGRRDDWTTVTQPKM